MLVFGAGLGILLSGAVNQPLYAQDPAPTPEPAETTPAEAVEPDTPASGPEAADALSPSGESPESETEAPNIAGETAAPAEPDADPEDLLTFTVLGLEEETIKGPSDTTTFRFGLPAHWQLSEDGELHLDFSNVIEFAGLQPATQENGGMMSGGDVAVSLNNIPLTTIPLRDIGDQRVVVPISAAALVPARDDGLHELDLELASAFECGSGSANKYHR